MSLGDINFIYKEKIDNLNNRMDRYNGIIKDYENTIKKAEKEENPNVSSVVKSKEDYENKIRNMECVKEYYQEFVDTSDYLMQYLNENETHLLIRKNEDLTNQLNELQQDYDYFVNSVDEHSNHINSLTAKVRKLSNENTRLKADLKYYKPYYSNSIEFESYIEELQTKIHDLELSKKGMVRKNMHLIDTIEDLNNKIESLDNKLKSYEKNFNELEIQNHEIDELQRQYKVLEDYCNHLLSRKCVEVDVGGGE